MNKNIIKLLAVLMMCFALVSVLVACEGEPGPQGPAGPEGPQGPAGEQGLQGERGPQGEAAKNPYIGEDGLLYVWDADANDYKGFDVKGEPGVPGEPGQDLDDCGEEHTWSKYIIEKYKHGYDVTTNTYTDGVYLRVCDECGDAEWYEGVIHEWTVDHKVPATCTEAGTIVYTCECTGSKTEIDSEAPALTHDFIVADEKTATCTTDGSITYTCSRACGEDGHTYTEKTDDAFGHTYDSGVEVLAATCTVKGTMLFTCQNGCGDTYTKEIDVLGHKYVDDQHVDATCLKDAYTPYHCERNCGEDGATGENVVEGTKLEHAAKVAFVANNIDDCWKLTNPDDCKCVKDQIYATVCANGCDTEVLYETVYAKGHAWSAPVASENINNIPACMWGQPWIKHCTECAKDHVNDSCNPYMTDHVDVPAPHNFVEANRTEATCITDGKVDYVCTICNQTKEAALGENYNPAEDVIPALGHAMAGATCTEASKCTRTGCDYTEGSALGHAMADATCTEASKCTRTGCDHTEGSALGHTYTKDSVYNAIPATFDKEGKIEFVCDTCCDIADTVILPKLNDDDYVKTTDDKDENGDKIECQNKKDYYKFTVALGNSEDAFDDFVYVITVTGMNAHSTIPPESEWILVENTTGGDDYWMYECTFCGKSIICGTVEKTNG